MFPVEFEYQSVITVRKRSLGQGNVSTRFCHSVHGKGGGRGSLYDVISCLAAWSMFLPEGVSVPGPMFLLRGGLCWGSLSDVGLCQKWGFCQGGFLSGGGGPCQEERVSVRRRGSLSGRGGLCQAEGVSVRRRGSLSGVVGLCQEEGVSVYGVSVRRGSLSGGGSLSLPYTVDERVVRILLEYSLSFFIIFDITEKKLKEFWNILSCQGFGFISVMSNIIKKSKVT